jgi:hypothetical protein
MTACCYIVVREGLRWSVIWMADGGDRLVDKFWSRAKALHIADHLHLAYHAGLTAPERRARS